MSRLPYLGLVCMLIIADQLSKWAVTERIIRPEIYNGANGLDFISWYVESPVRLPFASVEILPFFNLVMVWNQGVSFGMFANLGDIGPLLLIVLSAVISIWFLAWLFTSTNVTQKTAIAIVIGGAIGNVIDRVRFGAVIDFLDFHLLGWHYPAFNIADSAIVIGVFILIFYTLFFEKTVG